MSDMSSLPDLSGMYCAVCIDNMHEVHGESVMPGIMTNQWGDNKVGANRYVEGDILTFG